MIARLLVCALMLAAGLVACSVEVRDAAPNDAGSDVAIDAAPLDAGAEAGPFDQRCIDFRLCLALFPKIESRCWPWHTPDLFLEAGVDMFERCTFDCETTDRKDACVISHGGRCAPLDDGGKSYCVPR